MRLQTLQNLDANMEGVFAETVTYSLSLNIIVLNRSDCVQFTTSYTLQYQENAVVIAFNLQHLKHFNTKKSQLIAINTITMLHQH